MSKNPAGGRRRRVPGESIAGRIVGRGTIRGAGSGSGLFHRLGIQDPFTVSVGGERFDRLIAEDTGPFTYLSGAGYRQEVRDARYRLLQRLSVERTGRRAGERLHRIGPVAVEEGVAPRLLESAPALVPLTEAPTVIEVPVSATAPVARRAAAPGRSRVGRRKAPRTSATALALPAPRPVSAPRTAAPPAAPRVAPSSRAFQRASSGSVAARLLRAVLTATQAAHRPRVQALLRSVERGDLSVDADEVRELVRSLPPAGRARLRAESDPEVVSRVALRRVTAEAPSVRALERREPSPLAAEVDSVAASRRGPPSAAAVRRAVAARPVARARRWERIERREAEPTVAPAVAAPLSRAVAPSSRTRVALAEPVTRPGAAAAAHRSVLRPWSDAAPAETLLDAPERDGEVRTGERATVRALRRLSVPASPALAPAPMAYAAATPAVEPRAEVAPDVVARPGEKPSAGRPRRRSPAAPVERRRRPPSERPRREASRLSLQTGRPAPAGRESNPAGRVAPSSPPAIRAALRSTPIPSVDGQGRRELRPRPAGFVSAARSPVDGAFVSAMTPNAHSLATEASSLPRPPLGQVARASLRAEAPVRLDGRARTLSAPVAVPATQSRLLEPSGFVLPDAAPPPPPADVAPVAASSRARRRSASAVGTRRERAGAPRPTGRRESAPGRPVAGAAAPRPTGRRESAPGRPVAGAVARAAARSETVQTARSSRARPIPRPAPVDAVSPTLATPGPSSEGDTLVAMAPAARAAARERVAVRVDRRDRVQIAPVAVAPTLTARAARPVPEVGSAVLVRPLTPFEAESASVEGRLLTGRPLAGLALAARPASRAAPVVPPAARVAARAGERAGVETVVPRSTTSLDVGALLMLLAGRSDAPGPRADGPDRSARREAAPVRGVGRASSSAGVAPSRVALAPEPSSEASAPGAEQRVRSAVHAALRSQRPAAVTPGARRVVREVGGRPDRRRPVVEARILQAADGRVERIVAERRTADGRVVAVAPPHLPLVASALPLPTAVERVEARASTSVASPGGRAARRIVEARPQGFAGRRHPTGSVSPVGLGPAGLADAPLGEEGERRSLSASLADLEAPVRQRSGRISARRRPFRSAATANDPTRVEAGERSEGVAAAPDRPWARRLAPERGQRGLRTPDRLADLDARDDRETRVRTGGSLLTALARSGDPEEVVRVILERSSGVASAANALGAEARSLVDRIVRTANNERQERVSAQVAALPQLRTVNRRILTPAASQSSGGSSRSGGPTSTPVQGVGASGAMKLAGKLMKLIHLAENERRKADAQREVRMAEETGSTRREAGAGQTGGENVANQTMNLKVLQQQVLDSILQKLEEQRWRRDDPDGPTVGG